MEVTRFNNLSLPEKEVLVKEKGQLVQAQDFYSFYVLHYALDEHAIRVTYDFSGRLIDVETDNETEACDDFSRAVNLFSR